MRHRSEGYPDPIFLDPDNSAFVDRGVLRHHEFKARRNERRVLHIVAAPSGEMFRTMQLITEPPDDT